MALSVIGDLESGKEEFERIKQNFTPSPPDPDALENLTEVQTTFEGLQSELHDFLAQHLDKVVGLQARIATSLSTTTRTSHGSDAQRTVLHTTSPRMSHYSTAEPQTGIDDALSDRRISVKPTIRVENIPLDTHLRNFQTFLNAQMENIRQLHDASYSSIPHKDKEERKDKEGRAAGEENTDKLHEGSNVSFDFNTMLAIFVLMATLVMVFLLLVITIIGTKHRMPFSVAMFFSFLALASIFIGIFTARQGLMVLERAKKKNNTTTEILNFYSQLLEQLQLVAIVLFIISIIVTMFIIFTSLAFPLVALFLSGLGALVIFSSVYWEVSLTFKNIQYLAKNLRRLRAAVEFVKYTRKTVTPAPLF